MKETVSYRSHVRRRWCVEVDVLEASRDARMQSESSILFHVGLNYFAILILLMHSSKEKQRKYC